MSCNGCRALRKGCNETCIIRQSLQGIESPQAQVNATLFVAKFFGRAGLMSFLSSVPQIQRPALFQSLLTEACGRRVNPVNGAVGLLGTGNWHLCQSAVETVLCGGIPRPLSDFEECSGANHDDLYETQGLNMKLKRKGLDISESGLLDTSLAARMPVRMTAGGRVNRRRENGRRPASSSNESGTTTSESGIVCQQDLQQGHHVHDTKLLKLFL